MSIFRIHCVARSEPWGKSFFTQLEALFNEVCSHPKSAFKEASAYWWTHRPLHHLANEPLVWLVADKNSSILKKAYPRVNIPTHVAGLTYWGGKGAVSEIYLDHAANKSSEAQAKMSFHELMHNKLQVGNELHGSDYGSGLNKEMLDLSTTFAAILDSENIKWMAPALNKQIPQWVPPF